MSSPRTRRSQAADAVLAEAVAVERGGVHVAHARIEAGVERLVGGLVVDRVVHVAKRRAAESEYCERDIRTAEFSPFQFHAILPV